MIYYLVISASNIINKRVTLKSESYILRAY